MRHRAILLPGAVLPARLAYPALIEALGPDVDAIAKDLELYAADAPPPGYGLEHEVEGVLREADARGWRTFHLVGYSAGGASALAFAARHPDRLSSLALLEPAWAGRWDRSPAEAALWREADRLADLPSAEEYMASFVRLNLAPGVEPSPPPPGVELPSPESRHAGISALTRSFKTYDLDRDALASFGRPVYYALGARSNQDQYGEIAKRLSSVFGDFELEVFDDRHHFDPPHRIEPERLARSLRALWARAEPA